MRYKLPFFLFFISALWLVTSCSQKPTKPFEVPSLYSDESSVYEYEKRRLIDRDPDVDFTQLRLSYTTTPGYTPWDTKLHEASLAMFNAYEDENYALCIQFADAMFAQNYISLAAHFGAYSCYLAQENHAKAAYHRYVVSGLMHSIAISGDGLSEKSPYITISPAEMRSFLQIRGLISYRQEFVSATAKHIEKVFVINANTEEHQVLYFDNSMALMPKLKHMMPSMPSIPPPTIAPSASNTSNE